MSEGGDREKSRDGFGFKIRVVCLEGRIGNSGKKREGKVVREERENPNPRKKEANGSVTANTWGLLGDVSRDGNGVASVLVC